MIRLFAKLTEWSGSMPAVIGALVVVIAWAVSGPLFSFSSTWQLVINTGTTIITFLMVFVIQNTQNRSERAFHTKLDEILRAVVGADASLSGLEELPAAEIKARQSEVRRMTETPTDGMMGP